MVSRTTLLLAPLLLLGSASAAEFACEKLQKAQFFSNEVMTCFMVIVQPGQQTKAFTKKKFDSTLGLTLQGNENIDTMPQHISRALINLENYDASNCAIKAIKKTNFYNLRNLKRVWLSNNAIDTVDSDTFDDNPLLEEITFGKCLIIKNSNLKIIKIRFTDNNKLKIVNGQVFQNLRNLEKASLLNNPCINMKFDTPSKIRELPQTVTRLCKFCEDGIDPSELTGCQKNLQTTSDKLQTCKTDLQATATAPNVAQLNELLERQLREQKEVSAKYESAQDNIISELKLFNADLKKTNNDLQIEIRGLRVQMEKLRKEKEILKEAQGIMRRNECASETTTDFE